MAHNLVRDFGGPLGFRSPAAVDKLLIYVCVYDPANDKPEFTYYAQGTNIVTDYDALIAMQPPPDENPASQPLMVDLAEFELCGLADHSFFFNDPRLEKPFRALRPRLRPFGGEGTPGAPTRPAGRDIDTFPVAPRGYRVKRGDKVTLFGFTTDQMDGSVRFVEDTGHVADVKIKSGYIIAPFQDTARPGVSGGPLLNSSGEVIGMYSFTPTGMYTMHGHSYFREIHFEMKKRYFHK